jgi:serine protease Do
MTSFVLNQSLRSLLRVAVASVVLVLVTSPLQLSFAQARALPDFTDLVDQVGPSVVNIRTLEKVTARGQSGAPGEEEMLEFFRRFGLPMPNVPNNPRQGPRQNRPQQEEEQPRGVGSG